MKRFRKRSPQMFLQWVKSGIKHKTCTREYWNSRSQAIKFLLFYGRLHFSALLPDHPSFSSTSPCDWNPQFAVKLNLFWIKFYIWKEIAFRCWPAAVGRGCTCGSDLVILVQTEVWSSLTKHSWLLKEAFTLCDYIDSLGHSSCAVFFSLWFFFSDRPFIWQFRHQADAVESRCSMSSPQSRAYFNDLFQSGTSGWISSHLLNFYVYLQKCLLWKWFLRNETSAGLFSEVK